MGIEKHLQELLPREALSTSPEDRAAYRVQNPLVAEGPAPTMVVRPKGVADLQQVIRLANQERHNLTVCSSKGAHGKGGLAASQEHVMIDLSDWKAIPWINRRNRVCLISPGVTYGELLAALKPHGLTASIPLAPRRDKSVLAAVMDWEPSTWPNKQWDIGDPVCSTEFVFGHGELFRTGAAGGPGTLEQQRAAGGAQKCPTGPSQADFHRVVQGSQGTMGVVSWITLRTEVLPTVQKTFLLGAKRLEKLIPYVYEVQRPWLGEHSFIMNRTALAMLMLGQSGTSFDEICRGLPAYSCLQNIAGFDRLPQERVAYQTRDIGRIAADSQLSLHESLGAVGAADVLAAATSPTADGDWRHRWRGQCLSIFFQTTLDRTPRFIRLLPQIFKDCGVAEAPVGLYIQPLVQNHFCHMELLFPYDPGDGLAVKDMQTLEREAVAQLMAAGAFFSRPYGAASQDIFKRNPMHYTVLKKIKTIFDPGRVLNRGKWGL
ncbi:MAG TPA: FAD-binding oxidoreductase [Deltaproteobacteria bacterium]|nr:FAD-binding oxidoreductase [Deltaproteobacteria bacterium]